MEAFTIIAWSMCRVRSLKSISDHVIYIVRRTEFRTPESRSPALGHPTPVLIPSNISPHKYKYHLSRKLRQQNFLNFN